tara:strand:- start:291 stop:905 length:615 start_codon:yes stop_codon:yes gene_type:complete
MKFILFDLGGVVVQIKRTWQEACHGVNLIGPADSLDIQPEIKELYHRYHAGRFDVLELATQLSKLTRGRLSPKECLKAHRGILIGEYPQILELIENLKKQNQDMAVLSNTCADHWKILATYPSILTINKYFTSFAMGLSKPDARIYRAVQSELNVAPTQLLFFDDSPENIEAARACDWNAELIDPQTNPCNQIKHYLQRYNIQH